MSTFPGEAKQRIGSEEDGLGRERKTHCKKGHPYDEANTYWHYNWKGYQCRGCRACVREAMQKHRLDPAVRKRGADRMVRWRKAHPEEYKIQYTQVFKDKQKILADARIGGCIQCGEKRLECLDFHHRDRTTKLGHIGEFRKFGIRRLLAEIAKCDVLCANCHRTFHKVERDQKQVLEGV